MSISKKIITIFTSFILMLGIICSTFLIIFNIFFAKENILKKFEEINLYNSIYEEVRNGFENYIYQSGLDINVIDKICSKEKVKNDINAVINSMYGEEIFSVDSTEIRTNLDNAIKEYVETQGRKLSNEEEESIKKFEDLIEDSYKEEIGFYQKGSDKIVKVLPQILNNIKKAEMICVGVTIFILIILLIINGNKNLYVTGSYVGTSLLSSGIIIIIAKNIITRKIDIDSLVLFTQSLTGAIINLANSILNKFQIYGIFYIIIGFLLIIIMNILNIKYENK